MKDVRAISRDKDFFEQMKQIIGQKSWCFIDEKVLEHIKKEAGCYTTDVEHRKMNISFCGKRISVEYTSGEMWHRIRWIKTYDVYIYVCQDPEEVLFITME